MSCERSKRKIEGRDRKMRGRTIQGRYGEGEGQMQERETLGRADMRRIQGRIRKGSTGKRDGTDRY